MVRFLKKLWKSSKKPVPPGDPTNRATDADAEPNRDSKGENRSREILADKTDETDSPLLFGMNHEGGSGIANQDGRVENQRLPASNTSTPTPGSLNGDAGEYRRS